MQFSSKSNLAAPPAMEHKSEVGHLSITLWAASPWIEYKL